MKSSVYISCAHSDDDNNNKYFSTNEINGFVFQFKTTCFQLFFVPCISLASEVYGLYEMNMKKHGIIFWTEFIDLCVCVYGYGYVCHRNRHLTVLIPLSIEI